MDDTDEARALRNRLEELEQALASIEARDVEPGTSRLARTKMISSYPTGPLAMYGMEPLVLLGAEAEGNAGVVSGDGSTFYALNLGSGSPPAGTQVIVSAVAHRWCFRYDA